MFLFLHSLLELISTERHLFNVNRRRCNTIYIRVKFLGKLHNVNAELLPVGVELIGKVLETGSDYVFCNWKESVLDCRVGSRMKTNLVGSRRGESVGFIVVEDEEVL